MAGMKPQYVDLKQDIEMSSPKSFRQTKSKKVAFQKQREPLKLQGSKSTLSPAIKKKSLLNFEEIATETNDEFELESGANVKIINKPFLPNESIQQLLSLQKVDINVQFDASDDASRDEKPGKQT